MTEARDDDAQTRIRRAASLKERIYVAFTALAVIIALRAHDEHPDAGLALGTLAITVAATVCAVYVADLLSHMVVHSRVPGRVEHRHMVASTLGAATVALPPLACIGLAALGLYDASTGLLAAMLITTATLVAIGLLAVRRLAVPRLQRIVILVGEAVLAIGVIALELLSHG
ncbi:hypothetical protein [Microbacterium sp. SORGH_AS_0862]|uniref:hypothetical protein n=1 Tax=Microbacterium sp. SORGH_AS_0862 TaxID=3041789 RepID=UPI00279251CA|nr:hypothetical protein [Microbacterium sp. SORGH_AS_0862]MDQ1203842.1 hypothetical protein [Microbacterium sp. SORGH_AS_0862]